MTKKELNKLYYINRAIERRKQRIEELEAEVMKMTTYFSGMPKGRQNTDRFSRIVAEILDEKKMVSVKLEELAIERRRLECYIESIPDEKIRMYMSLRYINGMSWVQIAFHTGNNASDDGIRKAVDRYLNHERKNDGNLAGIRKQN